MPTRKLSWHDDAVEELLALLSRRKDKIRVQDCIESNACLVAEEPGVATVEQGPSHFLVHRFTCNDGDVGIFVQLVFDADDPIVLYVISCKTIGF
jgi:hypothetical protein